MKDEEPKILWHYTPASTLVYLQNWKEVLQGGDECLNFTATYYATLNDSKEYEAMSNHPICNEKEGFEKQYGSPFVVSLTENEDSLLSWCMYGDRARGVALGFDRKELINKMDLCTEPDTCNETKMYLLKCVYGSENPPGGGDFAKFAKDCVARKDSFFADENEWRIVMFKKECFFRPCSSGIVPCVEVKIPIECLAKIIVGKMASPLTRNAVKAWTEMSAKKAVHEIKVVGSSGSLQ